MDELKTAVAGMLMAGPGLDDGPLVLPCDWMKRLPPIAWWVKQTRGAVVTHPVRQQSRRLFGELGHRCTVVTLARSSQR